MINKEKFMEIYKEKQAYCTSVTCNKCKYYNGEFDECKPLILQDIIDEYNSNETKERQPYDKFLYKVSGRYITDEYNFGFQVYKTGVRLADIRKMFNDDYLIDRIECVGKLVNDKYVPY